MTSPADDIPDLERLMRNVIRMAMEAERGAGWIATLSSAQQASMERARELAAKKRPGEPVRDGWDAAGLGEIGSFLRSEWLPEMAHVWPDQQAAAVDIERLVAYRDKNLHALGPPSGQVGDREVGAMMLRLRVGFEAARRDLLDETGDWWPYIAAVHSNVPEFQFERSGGGQMARHATLTEGDIVFLDAVGVHPTGDSTMLRYRLLGQSVPEIGSGEWGTDPSFVFSVPRVQMLGLNLYVDAGETDETELTNIEWVHFGIKVRPIAL